VPEAIWKEQDMIDGKRVDAMVAILRTTGCWWSRSKGCTMCGYNLSSMDSITGDDLLSQLEAVAERYGDEAFVKVYTSGSFLDPNEVPMDVRERVYSMFKGAGRLLVESRPEFVTPENLEDAPSNLCMALGMESSSDVVLSTMVRKGFTVADHLRAVDVLQKRGIPIRNYLLLKPMYMSEMEAMEDVLASVRFCAHYSEDISINPINVQKDTDVERLWRRGEYRPPYLWSLVEVLRQAKDVTDKRVFSSPSGGGSQRGVHNCGECDRKVLEAVERFSFSQDLGDLEGLDCPCRREWEMTARMEDLIGTSVDVQRYLSDWTTY